MGLISLYLCNKKYIFLCLIRIIAFTQYEPFKSPKKRISSEIVYSSGIRILARNKELGAQIYRKVEKIKFGVLLTRETIIYSDSNHKHVFTDREKCKASLYKII